MPSRMPTVLTRSFSVSRPTVAWPRSPGHPGQVTRERGAGQETNNRGGRTHQGRAETEASFQTEVLPEYLAEEITMCIASECN